MAGRAPFFITGANCKIRVNGVTLAFATELSYNVSINHQQAKVLGQYEADTIEPISYNITGQFTVIRYLEGVKDLVNNPPNGTHKLGNGVGSFNIASNMGSGVASIVGAVGATGTADKSLDPSTLSMSSGFDIEVYQKIPGNSVNGQAASILTGRGVELGGVSRNSSGIARLRDCHIVGMQTNISKRGFMMQTFQFMANYLDEDSFLSSSSSQWIGG